MTTKRPHNSGPIQLSEHLGLAPWQLERALRLGLIPRADRKPRRWSAAIADDALAHIDDIRAKAGTVPDVGANRPFPFALEARQRTRRLDSDGSRGR